MPFSVLQFSQYNSQFSPSYRSQYTDSSQLRVKTAPCSNIANCCTGFCFPPCMLGLPQESYLFMSENEAYQTCVIILNSLLDVLRSLLHTYRTKFISVDLYVVARDWSCASAHYSECGSVSFHCALLMHSAHQHKPCRRFMERPGLTTHHCPYHAKRVPYEKDKRIASFSNWFHGHSHPSPHSVRMASHSCFHHSTNRK